MCDGNTFRWMNAPTLRVHTWDVAAQMRSRLDVKPPGPGPRWDLVPVGGGGGRPGLRGRARTGVRGGRPPGEVEREGGGREGRRRQYRPLPPHPPPNNNSRRGWGRFPHVCHNRIYEFATWRGMGPAAVPGLPQPGPRAAGGGARFTQSRSAPSQTELCSGAWVDPLPQLPPATCPRPKLSPPAPQQASV